MEPLPDHHTPQGLAYNPEAGTGAYSVQSVLWLLLLWAHAALPSLHTALLPRVTLLGLGGTPSPLTGMAEAPSCTLLGLDKHALCLYSNI